MALYTGRLLMRGGNEADFDPDKMMPREWAVSTDKGIVRICFKPGVCIRMATYEAFEEDMAKIEKILKECQSIQEAVIRINEEVSKNADAVAEYTAQAKQYRDEAKQFRDEAFNATPSGYENLVQNVADNTVKIDTVIEKAELNIKNTASGENIHLTDSADGKVVEFALYGKATQKTTTGAQLLNYDAWKNVITTRGTSVFENNGITITATTDDAYTNYNVSGGFPENAKIPVSEGEVITLSWEESSNKKGTILIFPEGKTSGTVAGYNNQVKKLSYTVPTGVTFITFRFGVATAGETISYKNIMINKGSEPLPYEPYTGGIPSPNPNYKQDIQISGASGSVVGKSCGKNIVNTSIVNYDSSTGVTVVENEDKTYTLNGTATKNGYITLSKNLYLKGKFVISGGNSNCNLYAWVSNNKYYWDSGNSVAFENYDETKYFTLNAHIVQGKTYTNEKIKPMIRACDENGNPIGDDTYEPYKETSSTILTPNGLAGIDVDSGGNYTDENGQMRIADVIYKYADGSGEHIRKIEKASPNLFVNNVVDASKWTGVKDKHTNYRYYQSGVKQYGAIISNITEAKNPTELWVDDILGCSLIADNGIDFSMSYDVLGITKDAAADERVVAIKNYLSNHTVYFYYELAEPIRTPLTAEQIAEIEKLCTFYPVTNISNDSDCGMEITYMADAKNYIDNRLALIETAMLSNI